MAAKSYNYDRFDEYVESGQELAEFAAFPNHLHVGDPAPDFTAFHLEAKRPMQLSDAWATKTVVLEFGSFT